MASRMLPSVPSSMLRYLKNGTFYHFFRRAPTAPELHFPCKRWDPGEDAPSGSEALALESPGLKGLWLLRSCIDATQVARIKGLLATIHGRQTFQWYNYELGRRMMPIHAVPPLDEHAVQRILLGLDVFGAPGSQGADPLEGWPQLSSLLAEGLEGARELQELQELPLRAIPEFAGEPCLFGQAQFLECGAEVTPHRDALPFGGNMIATFVLEGSSEVRVGPLRFRVDTGDMYAIAHSARYEVEHEVMAAPHDRLSVTFRYGLGFPEALPALPGDELRQQAGADRGGPSSIWEA
ncbi:unnamed protein product [Polarella glacialis]|uniref:Fe2OG dioxygenase domain-containing protein n=1 Tax=Polarella glacialis TaxID=89957 RepID=A0A813FGG6_POLGL|nr:unnamed protein product [Polarella glacialis]